MAQVSYGTITITDTTDLTTYIRYATKAPLTAASQFQETPTTDTRYIAVLSIPTSDSIPAWNSSSWKWSEFIGTDGLSVLGTREIYYLKTNSVTVAAPANGSDISQSSANVENQWTKSVPTYVINGEYWTCIQTHLDGSPTWVYGSPVLNQSLTDMNHDIDVMKSVTQQSMEDSQGAMSQAASAVKEVKRIWFAKATSDLPAAPPETGVTTGSASTYNSWSIVKPAENPSYPYYFYCDQTCTNGGVYSHSEILLEADPYTVNALNVRTKNFFHGKDSTYDGWFASGRSTSEGLNESDATTYYYNARFGATNITLGYNKTPVIDLDGASGAINIYRLPTINSSGLVTAAGKIGAKLNASALTFYNTSGTATSTFGDSIALASNGASITIGSTGTGKYNTYIDAQGLYLRTGTTPYATLNSNGLVLSKGGVNAGTSNTNNYVYISSENGPRIAINGYTPPDPTAQATLNAPQWREIIGTKFGVLSDGTLYASNANITGAIVATSLDLTTNNVKIGTGSINGLKAVATSGSYNDLTDKPTIPSLTGYIYVNGTIGSTPADGATGFVVATGGLLKASNAIVYGNIYASAGYIGGWQIGTDGNKTLHNGNANTSPTIGNGTIILSKGLTSSTSIAGSSGSQTWAFASGTNFGVTTNGTLYATGAHISGAITVSDAANSNIYTTSRTDELLEDKASVNAEYSVEIITSNFNPTATAAATYVTLTAKVTRTNGTVLGNISYKWYGDNTSSVVLSTSSSYNVPANKVWNGTSGYKTFTVEIS